MSWETINQILGLATLDDDFCQALLHEPLVAIQKRGFQLSQEEKEVFNHITAGSLPELTQLVFDELAPGRTRRRHSTDEAV